MAEQKKNDVKHTRLPWQQGRLLMTVVTKRWSEESRADHDAFEKRKIFCNFYTDDQGRGREFVAEARSAEDAEFIVRACNSHYELVEALYDMYQGWKYIRETHGDLPGVGWDRAEKKAFVALEKARQS
jgi:hypothetical protein